MKEIHKQCRYISLQGVLFLENTKYPKFNLHNCGKFIIDGDNNVFIELQEFNLDNLSKIFDSADEQITATRFDKKPVIAKEYACINFSVDKLKAQKWTLIFHGMNSAYSNREVLVQFDMQFTKFGRFKLLEDMFGSLPLYGKLDPQTIKFGYLDSEVIKDSKLAETVTKDAKPYYKANKEAKDLYKVSEKFFEIKSLGKVVSIDNVLEFAKSDEQTILTTRLGEYIVQEPLEQVRYFLNRFTDNNKLYKFADDQFSKLFNVLSDTYDIDLPNGNRYFYNDSDSLSDNFR